MNWHGLQIGIHKSKKRFPKNLNQHLTDENVEDIQRRLRKTTKQCSAVIHG